MPLQLRRGSETEIQSIIPSSGEPLWATDSHKLYIGDGSTLGGIEISGGGGGGYNQSLNTYNTATFAGLIINSNSIALGENSSYLLYNSVAVGASAQAANGSTSIGGQSLANSNYSTAVGYQAKSQAYKAVALGSTAVANNDYNIAIGSYAGLSLNNTITNATNSIIINAQSNQYLTAANSGLYIAPIRQETSSEILFYNNSTKEITRGDTLIKTTITSIQPDTENFTVLKQSGFNAFQINGEAPNPTLTLKRGHTYTFDVFAPAHPFWIMNTSTAYNPSNHYNSGVTNNGASGANQQPDILTFVVPGNAPDTLYYQCQNHDDFGVLNIINDSVMIDQYSTSTTKSAKWLIQVVDSSDNFQCVEILASHSGTSTYKTEYGELTNNGLLGSFSTTVSDGYVKLNFSNATAEGKTVKASRISL